MRQEHILNLCYCRVERSPIPTKIERGVMGSTMRSIQFFKSFHSTQKCDWASINVDLAIPVVKSFKEDAANTQLSNRVRMQKSNNFTMWHKL